METNTEATATSIAPTKPARRAAKKVSKTAAKKSTAKLVKKSDGDGIALKSICGQLKMEPRLARRKLRAAGLAFHGKRERWTFTPTQATKAKEILRA